MGGGGGCCCCWLLTVAISSSSRFSEADFDMFEVLPSFHMRRSQPFTFIFNDIPDSFLSLNVFFPRHCVITYRVRPIYLLFAPLPVLSALIFVQDTAADVKEWWSSPFIILFFVLLELH